MKTRRTSWLALSLFCALTLAGLAATAARRVQAQPGGNPELGLRADEARELAQQAKRLGVNVPDLLAAREKAEQEIRIAQAKQPAQLLASEDSLYVLDRNWLFQFDVKTLELKNMQNLDMLRDQHMRKFMEQQRGLGEQRPNEGARPR
ncbi:MAG: hypothetical protein COZ06_03505 [Armatimonadetes bacterium CG_4_10_14_3_um_filter_66_18]|nr:hypothetical protein [Armatimonadota bacterium]OIO99849.1 MAG: hypothetical protein AUJ96_19070 [Armatimonadetes bacterium CG2_30_66_41]PIU87601.1 MAG: hypothetical protein COS65_33935 [Armatimonadetes bacterium CG06_land_8_20_14_3_00_66_21]PIX43470.1 MAG: hypothetical protein COZ57_19135 [Armatimonadetes bacterium CG_4_8_14_3_um_filter_66_20]PIY52062.1 MAG: hypothetical protein COZ06_03505 [Armatimonadetes bacterium CG_4_10_14_3_um_filter_66_18]PIZ41798.1 MAG: hypothetical protein COY42_18